MAAAAASEGNKGRHLSHSSSYQFIPPSMSELRVVLLGNSWPQRSSVGNFILGRTEFSTEEGPDFLTARGRLKEKDIVLVNTPDLLRPSTSEDALKKQVETCARLSAPGPHVFLLVLQPEDFTDESELQLCRVLQLFGDRPFDHSLVLISPPREESSSFTDRDVPDQPLKDTIRRCRYRYLEQKNLERSELLTRLGQTAKENSGEHVGCDVFEDEDAGLIMKGTGDAEESARVRARILKEKEEEVKRRDEDLRRQHEEDLKSLKRKMKEQHQQEIEQERRLKAKQLKDKDECLNKEREERKEEREEEERKRKRREETQRQDWRRKLDASEKVVQSERERRGNAERKLELCRKEMKRDRDAWDKERKDMWERIRQEDKQNLEEERTSFRTLREEYHRKRRKWTFSLFVLLLSLLFLLYYVFLSYAYTHTTESAKTEEHA